MVKLQEGMEFQQKCENLLVLSLSTACTSSFKRYKKPKKYLKTGRKQVSCPCSRKVTGEIEQINEVAISLLASVGNILALILLNRLNEHISDFPLEIGSRKVYRKEKATLCSLH